MPAEALVAAAMLLCLTLYALTGGADFGGGVWDLLATGPRAQRHRRLVAQAIAPIWEANHVWLIAVIVLLFTAFPAAFAAAATFLHVPLTLMLIGIVLRGSAFVFRSFSRPSEAAYGRWSLAFAAGSVISPVMLGAGLGAAASGRLSSGGFLRPWLAPFPAAVGGFALALFAFLAAVYLIHETAEQDLKEDFRRRALAAAAASALLAGLCLSLAREGAPLIYQGLSRSWWSLPFHGLTGLAAAGAAGALFLRRYGAARLLAVCQVTIILWGWAFAQYPYLIVPDFTLGGSAAPVSVLRPVLAALAVGAVLVPPSFFFLYKVFKSRALGR